MRGEKKAREVRFKCLPELADYLSAATERASSKVFREKISQAYDEMRERRSESVKEEEAAFQGFYFLGLLLLAAYKSAADFLNAESAEGLTEVFSYNLFVQHSLRRLHAQRSEEDVKAFFLRLDEALEEAAEAEDLAFLMPYLKRFFARLQKISAEDHA
mgnify:CR=1 FL=1